MSFINNLVGSGRKTIPFLSKIVSDGEYVDIGGVSSFGCEYDPKDIDFFYTEHLRYGYYSEIVSFFNSMEDGDWIKFYKSRESGVAKFHFSSSSEKNVPDFFKKVDEVNARTPLFPFNQNNEEVYTDGSFVDNGLDCMKFIRLTDLSDISLGECFLDCFSDNYVLVAKKISDFKASERLDGLAKRHTEGGNENELTESVRSNRSIRDMVEAVEKIERSELSYFEVEVWIIVRSANPVELKDKVGEICSLLAKRKIGFCVEVFNLDKIGVESSVGVKPTMKRSLKYPISSECLSLLIPAHKNFIHESGIPFYSSDASQDEIYIDLLSGDLANYNFLVTGISGEGKTYLMNHVAFHSILKYGESVTIGFYDFGGSMKKTALYWGASVFSEKINPFQLKNPEFIFDFIVTLVGEGQFTKKSMGELFSIIKEEIETVSSFRELVEIIDKKHSQIVDFRYFFTHFFEYYTEDLVEIPRLFYVDFESVPKDILPAYILFLRQLSKSQYDILINFNDEIWHLITAIPSELRSDAKTARKKREINFFATQELDELHDSTDSPEGRAVRSIVSNSFGKISFSQPIIKSTVHDDEQRSILRTVRSKKNYYSEFLLSMGEVVKVVRLYPTNALLFELAQSEKDEVRKQNLFLQGELERREFRDAFDLYVRGKYQ